MSVRYSKKHVRRAADLTHEEWVEIDDTAIAVVVKTSVWSRTFVFSFLCPLATKKLALAMAEAFGRHAARFAQRTAGDRYEQFAKFWRTISEHPDAPRHSAQLRTGSRARWLRDEAVKFGASQYNNANRQTSAKACVQALWLVLEELTSCALLMGVPRVPTPKNIHRQKIPRSGLVELSGKVVAPSTSRQVSALIQRLRGLGVPIEDTEAEASVRAIVGLLPIDGEANLESVVKAYYAKNEELLAAIAAAAENEFLVHERWYREGKQLLERSNSQVLASFDDGKFFDVSNSVFRRHFPINDKATATANLLLLVLERFKGRMPSVHSLPLPFRSRMLKLVRELGGILKLDSMLNLHRSGIAAAALLYIADAGANVSTAITLGPDFERATSEPGIVELFSVKARANYAAVCDALPVKQAGREISTVQALRATRDATSELRKNFPGLANSLFVFRFFENPSVANEQFLRGQLRHLLKAAGLPLTLTLSGIRTAKAVAEMARDSNSLSGVRQVLQHAENSFQSADGYALKFPVRLQLEQQMAHFQELFQAGSATNISGALAWLGKSDGEAQMLVAKARRTGLGFLCAAPDAGARPTSTKGVTCTAVGECTQCHVRVFMVDKESLAEVIATNSSLKANLDRLQGESANRFASLWLDLFAFTEACISEVKRSQFAHLMPPAKRLAEKWIAEGFDITELRP